MQQSYRRPLVTPRRSHFDSGTYRAVLRILSFCAEASPSACSSPPRLLPSHPCRREQERSISSEGADYLDGIPGHRCPGLAESGDGGRQEAVGLDAHGRNSPVEGLSSREDGEVACDGPGNPVSRKEESGGVDELLMEDFSIDFSGLMKELDLVNEDGVGTCLPDSDDFEKTLQLENAGSLGQNESCVRVDATAHGEESEPTIWIDGSISDVWSVDDILPKENIYREPELLPGESGDRLDESGTEIQRKVHDFSGQSMDTPASEKLGAPQKNSAVCAVVEQEMEEGEIPDEAEFSKFSFKLESQNAPNDVRLEEIKLVDDSVEEGDATHVVSAYTSKKTPSGADVLNEELNRPVVESEQLTGRDEVKSQKKKMGSRGKKNIEGKSQTKIDMPNGLPINQIGVQQENKKRNGKGVKEFLSKGVAPRSSNLSVPGSKDSAEILAGEMALNTEDVKVQQKRKRGPLTESKKEKKKLAKKRKRAETNKKLGVKRLKLQMVSKPKKVIFCSFYQKGRCQKGDSCKFSHDFVPETKGMPCTFFARGTCLKGDECPFDHHLFKYPCHSYMTHGRCNRGDSCLFSHKIPIGDISSKASQATRTDVSVLSEKQTSQKCLNSTGLLSSANNTSMEATASTSAKCYIPENVTQQKNFIQPMRIPKGVSFLSFNEGTPTNNQNHGSDLRKDDVQVQKVEEKVVSSKLESLNKFVPDKSLSYRMFPPPMNENKSSYLLPKQPQQRSVEIMPSKSLSCRMFPPPMNENKSLFLLPKQPQQRLVEIMPSKSIQLTSSSDSLSSVAENFSNEERMVNDASRILEEFLFSGIDQSRREM